MERNRMTDTVMEKVITLDFIPFLLMFLSASSPSYPRILRTRGFVLRLLALNFTVFVSLSASMGITLDALTAGARSDIRMVKPEMAITAK